jgi:hypothetical protein
MQRQHQENASAPITTAAAEIVYEVYPSITGPSNVTLLDATDAMQSGDFQSNVLQVSDFQSDVLQVS